MSFASREWPKSLCSKYIGSDGLISGPFFVRDSIQFVSVVYNNTIGITIHLQPPRIQVHIISSEALAARGAQSSYHHCFGFCDGKAYITKVSWLDENSKQYTSEKGVFTNSTRSFVDEFSGRIVMCTDGFRQYEVIRF